MVDWRSENTPDASANTFDKSAITPVSFEHLSDGQRTALCLIADIARRICLLNPQLGRDAISKTPGLVLIDELDAHLHPKWQRLVTKGLKSAFPAIQFIVTSHSPQVLGELAPEEIILLCPAGAKHPQTSYGLDAAQVLDVIMEAPARNEEVSQKIEKLFQLITDNKLEAARADLNTLKAEAPGVPELAGAEALIHRQEALGR
jgi:predicted ATP-binding protein involved in virulence